jgi:hypothetical protein
MSERLKGGALQAFERYAAFRELDARAVVPYYAEPALFIGPPGVVVLATGAAGPWRIVVAVIHQPAPDHLTTLPRRWTRTPEPIARRLSSAYPLANDSSRFLAKSSGTSSAAK